MKSKFFEKRKTFLVEKLKFEVYFIKKLIILLNLIKQKLIIFRFWYKPERNKELVIIERIDNKNINNLDYQELNSNNQLLEKIKVKRNNFIQVNDILINKKIISKIKKVKKK